MADIKTGIFMRKYQKSESIPFILDGVWGLSLIQTFSKNLQDLGLKCQTPLRLKAWVKEVEGLFYWDFIFEPKKFL